MDDNKQRHHSLVKVNGLNNLGLLVTVFGRVVAVSAEVMYLDDGSGFDHGDPLVPGVKVLMPQGIDPPAIGSYVMATGISSCYDLGGVVYSQILTRRPEDVMSVAR